MTKSSHRTLATLKSPKPVPLLIAHAQSIVSCMTDNPQFPAPVPALWVISKAISDLERAQAVALTRARGTAEARDERGTMLESLLRQLRVYVQAAADADPENAAAIIASAGFSVQKPAERPPLVFAARPGAMSGEVKLIAPSAGHGSGYEWGYSVDGGNTWLSMPPTMQAKTRLAGLTSGTTVMFIYRPVTRTGPGHWSQAITAMLR